MSHYTVAVLHSPEQDIPELLAPYNENLEVEPYVWRTKSEMIKDAKDRVKDYYKDPKWYDDDEFRKKYIKPFLNAKTDEEFYNAERNDLDDREFDEDGNELNTYNPKSKWDWYSIGGRWGGMLKLKSGVDPEWEDDDWVSDSARIKDIDFSRDEEAYAKCYDWWVDNIDNEPEEWNDFYKKEYYEKMYKDAEDYANQCASFSTFAVVTPDGEWHEMGEMGWFGCSNETPEEARAWHDNYMNLVHSVPEDYYMTIVDCHI